MDLEPHTPLRSVKLQLAAATGLPVGRQRVMLGGIGSLVLIDKRWAGWRYQPKAPN